MLSCCDLSSHISPWLRRLICLSEILMPQPVELGVRSTTSDVMTPHPEFASRTPRSNVWRN